MKRLPLLALLAAAPAALHAQTAENLKQAILLYQNVQTTQARDMFLQVISPSSPFEVTRDQRVTAYEYLGAILATSGRADSAETYFRAAIERDPFADLDPNVFTATERAAFARAKLKTFKVGARQLVADTLDPQTDHITISAVTTHASTLQIMVASLTDSTFFPLYSADNDGLRQVQWNGTTPRGTLVPPGQYELLVRGQSTLDPGRADSAIVYFDVTHLYEPLEDTLLPIAPDQFLPERYPTSAARNSLLLGLSVASAALIIPSAVGNSSLGVPRAPALGISALGLITGVVAFVNRSQHPEIPQNVAYNESARQRRLQRNAAIVAANEAKLAKTKVLITPVLLAGASQ